MSKRIAEFDTAEDAMDFCRMKGSGFYEVVGGIDKLYAVIPKVLRTTNLGNPYEAPVVIGRSEEWEEDDYER